MPRYADSRMCPACSSTLVAGAPRCRGCRLPLQGPLAVELFETLSRADVLLDRLRSEVLLEQHAPVPATTRAAPDPDGPATPPSGRTGLRTASVPAILLGLGALCLIVAAVTFLVVTWSWLGVGGRTGVLVGLTLAAAGTGVVLGKRGLVVAAECLTTVSIGLMALDVVGAINAGWLGAPGPAASFALVGVGAAGFSAAVLVRSRRVACELGVAGGLMVACAGVAVASGHPGLVVFVAVPALAAVSALGALGGARVLAVTSALGAAASWLWLLLIGLERVSIDSSLHGLWIAGGAFPLLGAAALLALLGALPVPARVSRVALSAAATIATLLVALPALDEGATVVGLTLLVTLAAWSAAAALTSRAVALGPLALAAVPTVAFVAWYGLLAADGVWRVGSPFTSTAGVRLDQGIADASLLLVPLVAALLVATRVLLRLPRPRSADAVLLMAAVVATVASYDVPLAVVVGLVAITALGLAQLGRPGFACGAVVVMVGAGLPSAVLTTLTCAVAVAVALLLLHAGRGLPTLLGGLLLPAAAGGQVWSAAAVAGAAVDLRAVPVLVVVGVVAIARPRVEVEVSAALVALVAGVASVAVAADLPTTLAVELTVAGALVTLSSLLHPERRVLAWPGGVLLAAATWVRLADLGVQAPEAYTLPSAAVLVLVALRQLWRAPEAGTAVLMPGLTLATVPSLLWVAFVEPTGPRAVLLGIGCLGLVLAGARLGWSAPLAVGSVVGGLLVARELAPYGGHVPQWVLIGLAGTVLTVVGVTWEERLLELRRATAYLGRLR